MEAPLGNSSESGPLGPDSLFIPGIAQKTKGYGGKNNTGAVGKFYELINQQAQRLEFTTQLACFVKQEKYHFAKLLLPVI
jgi:hypothetical protein